MNFLVKKAISPSNFSRPPPTIAPLPAPSTPASRPLYPRFRTLYPRTPAPPVHPLKTGRSDYKTKCILIQIPPTQWPAFVCYLPPGTQAKGDQKTILRGDYIKNTCSNSSNDMMKGGKSPTNFPETVMRMHNSRSKVLLCREYFTQGRQSVQVGAIQ